MHAELLAQGISLILYGMGFVFLFLAVLVLATRLMSSIVARYEPQPVPVTAEVEPQIVAAISAAIQRHRSK